MRIFLLSFFFLFAVGNAAAQSNLPSFYIDQMKVIELINITGVPDYEDMMDTTIAGINVELYPGHYTITDGVSWSISFQFDGLVIGAQFLTFHYSNVNGTVRAVNGSPVVGEEGVPITEETPTGKTQTTNNMLIILSNFNAWYKKAGLK
jgi:hypothetical protein